MRSLALAFLALIAPAALFPVATAAAAAPSPSQIGVARGPTEATSVMYRRGGAGAFRGGRYHGGAAAFRGGRYFHGGAAGVRGGGVYGGGGVAAQGGWRCRPRRRLCGRQRRFGNWRRRHRRFRSRLYPGRNRRGWRGLRARSVCPGRSGLWPRRHGSRPPGLCGRALWPGARRKALIAPRLAPLLARPANLERQTRRSGAERAPLDQGRPSNSRPALLPAR